MIYINKIFIFILFLFQSNFIQADAYVNFNKENAKYWQYISDQTMGGISQGQAFLDKDGDFYFARLTGKTTIIKLKKGFLPMKDGQVKI